jgi:hypothetical protein
MEQLLPLVLKVGEVNLKCMALLDGPTPRPTARRCPSPCR